MHRFPLAAVIVSTILSASQAIAAPLPSPAPAASANSVKSAMHHVSGLSNTVHVPKGLNYTVSSDACNRRTIAENPPQNQLGPNGASASQTVVAVPLGGASVSSATRDHEISEVCAHQRE